MGRARSTARTPSYRWECSRIGTGYPLAFSIFPGNQNEQQSLKPLEKTILQKFGHSKFIYCCDTELGPEGNREFNHMGERSFIVTQSIKKLHQRLIITSSPNYAANSEGNLQEAGRTCRKNVGIREEKGRKEEP